jgi:hypothetical protein
VKDKTDGQQGGPLDMFIFNLTIHHLWGRVLTKCPQTRSLAYIDDGYIKLRISVTRQVLAELNNVLKEDDVKSVLVSVCLFVLMLLYGTL